MAKNISNDIVDFSNPEAAEAAIAAATAELVAATPADKKEKAPKEKKPKVVKVTFVADKDYAAGETISFDYELPKSEGIRGVNSGIALEDMNEAQLKIEHRNASSVLYKTKKAGNDATKAQARFDAVVAQMEAKGIKSGTHTANVDAATVAELIKSGKISVDDIQALLDGVNA